MLPLFFIGFCFVEGVFRWVVFFWRRFLLVVVVVVVVVAVL